ncbi:hypothetical protein LTR96_011797, partial [Exophiala xenobiotica]
VRLRILSGSAEHIRHLTTLVQNPAETIELHISVNENCDEVTQGFKARLLTETQAYSTVNESVAIDTRRSYTPWKDLDKSLKDRIQERDPLDATIISTSHPDIPGLLFQSSYVVVPAGSSDLTLGKELLHDLIALGKPELSL